MITSITRHTMITMLIGFALICFTHYLPRAQKTNEAYTAKTENIIFKWLKMVFLSDIFLWMTISETDGIVYSPKEQGMSPLSHISLHWFLDTPNSLFLIPHYPPPNVYWIPTQCQAPLCSWETALSKLPKSLLSKSLHSGGRGQRQQTNNTQ